MSVIILNSVKVKAAMLCVLMENVVMLAIIMEKVIMLAIIMKKVNMSNAIIVSAIELRVVAPF